LLGARFGRVRVLEQQPIQQWLGLIFDAASIGYSLTQHGADYHNVNDAGIISNGHSSPAEPNRKRRREESLVFGKSETRHLVSYNG